MIHCDANNKSTTKYIPELVQRKEGQNVSVCTFYDFSFTTTKFWSIYGVTLFGNICMILIEVAEIIRDGLSYFSSEGMAMYNALDWINILSTGICLMATWFDKDTAIWFGSFSVLFSWIILSKAIGDIPVIGNQNQYIIRILKHINTVHLDWLISSI